MSAKVYDQYFHLSPISPRAIFRARDFLRIGCRSIRSRHGPVAMKYLDKRDTLVAPGLSRGLADSVSIEPLSYARSTLDHPLSASEPFEVDRLTMFWSRDSNGIDPTGFF